LSAAESKLHSLLSLIQLRQSLAEYLYDNSREDCFQRGEQAVHFTLSNSHREQIKRSTHFALSLKNKEIEIGRRSKTDRQKEEKTFHAAKQEFNFARARPTTFLLLCAKSPPLLEKEVNQHLQNQYLPKCGVGGARQSFNNFLKLSEMEK
jgi:hypothetical protein